MDFFSTVRARRSIRRFTPTQVPPEVIRNALEAAVLAPNSSNMQTWDFYWVRTPEKKALVVEACLNQSAARTAAELVVVTANAGKWKRANPELVKWARDAKAPQPVIDYYEKLVPLTYRWGLFNVWAFWKWLTVTTAGFFRPVPRGPYTRGDVENVAMKSAALAAENFVLAVTAQGFQTCMMEGFDAWRVRRVLGLRRSDVIVMVVAVGEAQATGTWGPRYRLPHDWVCHEV